jgi:hypothetical protein
MVRQHPGFEDVRSVLLFQATFTDQSLPSSRQRVRSHGKAHLSADTLVSDLVSVVDGLGWTLLGEQRSASDVATESDRRRLRAMPQQAGSSVMTISSAATRDAGV